MPLAQFIVVEVSVACSESNNANLLLLLLFDVLGISVLLQVPNIT